MAFHLLRVFSRLAIGTAKSTNTTSAGTFRKALIPAIFMQETSRSMASNQSSIPIMENKPPIPSHKPAMMTKSIELRTLPNNDKNQRVAVIFAWMLAKTRHLHKFDSFYKKQGFDVLLVRITPWQLLWPAKGTHLVALDVLNFLAWKSQYETILIHGFSVGAYQYGEVLLKMVDNKERFDTIRQKIIGQIFDSAVDYYGIPNGLAKAITANKLLQNTLQVYISYHMRTFNEAATKHYLASSEQFHDTCVNAPALFFFSKDDPVATPEGNYAVIRKWEKKGMKVFTKCFESSPHVSHLHKHTDDYLEELSTFLKTLGVLAEPYRRKSKLASKL